MQLKTILNLVANQPGFVFACVAFAAKTQAIVVHLRARAGSRPFCSGCGKRRRCYDHLPERRFQFVPLWRIPVWFVCAPRRVECPRCGVLVELMPWAVGKSHATNAFTWFLASWAKALSWKETARRFDTSWHTVFTAVRHAVEWGRAHMCLDNIQSIGVDELAWKKGHKYLTVVYQIDHHCRRLLWIGKDRKAETFARFFDWLGEARSQLVRFVASDMWAAFLGTAARRASAAVHVLDRFHVMQLFNKAIDQVRRIEARQLRARGDTVTLKHARWPLLKRRDNLTNRQRGRLAELLRTNLSSVKAYLLREDFQVFWTYHSVHWAKRFLEAWTHAAVRSRIEPVVKFARTLRKHSDKLLNWFRARQAFAAGAVGVPPELLGRHVEERAE